jgi:hypothetical protein
VFNARLELSRFGQAYRRRTLGSTVRRGVDRPGGAREKYLIYRSVTVCRVSTIPLPSRWFLSANLWTADLTRKEDAFRISGDKPLAHGSDVVYFVETKVPEDNDPIFQKIDAFRKSGMEFAVRSSFARARIVTLTSRVELSSSMHEL